MLMGMALAMTSVTLLPSERGRWCTFSFVTPPIDASVSHELDTALPKPKTKKPPEPFDSEG
jgi:hypothetical protein